MNYLSPPDVAAKHGIPLRTVQNACATGELPSDKLGRFYAVEPEAAEAYAAGWRERRTSREASGEPVVETAVLAPETVPENR